MIKAEVVRLGDREPRDNQRFVVTNLRQTPRFVYHGSTAPAATSRTGSDRSMAADRPPSCCRFWANQLRGSSPPP